MNANPQTPWADTITGMTPLRGSERQITWAEELRRSALWALREYYNDCRIEGMRAQGYNFPAGEIFSVEILNMVEDARWFIDHCRGCIHPLTLLRTLERTHNRAMVALYARYAV